MSAVRRGEILGHYSLHVSVRPTDPRKSEWSAVVKKSSEAVDGCLVGWLVIGLAHTDSRTQE